MATSCDANSPTGLTLATAAAATSCSACRTTPAAAAAPRTATGPRRPVTPRRGIAATRHAPTPTLTTAKVTLAHTAFASCGVTVHAARAAVRRYKAGRIPTPKPAGLEPKTVRNIHLAVHRALVDAVAWKHLVDNPADNAKPPRVARTRRPVWTPGQAAQFMDSVCFDRFYALFRLELTTGLRRAEICGIRWPSLDLEAGALSVHQGRVVVSGRAQDAEVKSEDSVRLIALDAETVSALRTRKAIQDAERALYGDDFRDTDLVFTYDHGRPAHPDSIRERFKRLAARAAATCWDAAKPWRRHRTPETEFG